MRKSAVRWTLLLVLYPLLCAAPRLHWGAVWSRLSASQSTEEGGEGGRARQGEERKKTLFQGSKAQVEAAWAQSLDDSSPSSNLCATIRAGGAPEPSAAIQSHWATDSAAYCAASPLLLPPRWRALPHRDERMAAPDRVSTRSATPQSLRRLCECAPRQAGGVRATRGGVERAEPRRACAANASCAVARSVCRATVGGDVSKSKRRRE
eukprot:364391-Chlamydomonas_euryale.AAC.3